MAEEDSAILRRIWGNLYKPTLDILFREWEAGGVVLTPEVAIEEMEQILKSVFLSIQEERTYTLEGDPIAGRRLYFRFDRMEFRQEAQQYAVNLFQNTYSPHNGEALEGVANSIDRECELPESKRAPSVIPQPGTIREALRKQGSSFLTDEIAEAIAKRFGARSK